MFQDIMSSIQLLPQFCKVFIGDMFYPYPSDRRVKPVLIVHCVITYLLQLWVTIATYIYPNNALK